MKMSSVRLLVRDFDACFDFYAETMGFKVTWGKKGEAYASFDVGGVNSNFALFKLELNNDFLGIPNGPLDPNLKVEDKVMISFASDDVDATCEALKNKGVTIIAEPTDMPGWGMRCAQLRDPEGHLIEIGTPFPTEKWAQDLQELSKEYDWKENQ